MDVMIGMDGDRRIEARFDRFPERARANLRQRIAAIIGVLETRVEAAEPSRTGKLRSETAGFVDEQPDFIRGRVRIVTRRGGAAEGGKAAALEYGAHGTASVKGHARTLDHVFARAIEPQRVFVEAYTRHPDIAAHLFLRGPLAEMRGDIMDQLRDALGEAAVEP